MLHREFLHFAIGGTLGFIVDASLLQLMVKLGGADPFAARVISVLVAIVCTWQYNRHITFVARRSPRWLAEFGRYLLGNGAGLCVNYLAYVLLLVWLPSLRESPWPGVAAGAVAGMLVNFAAARHFAFRGPPAPR